MPDPVPPARRDEGELAEARETNKRLNRRLQEAEAALCEWQKVAGMAHEQRTGRFFPALMAWALGQADQANEHLSRMLTESRAAESAAFARGRAEGSAQAIDLAQKAAEQRGYQRGIEEVADRGEWMRRDDGSLVTEEHRCQAWLYFRIPVADGADLSCKAFKRDALRALLGGADRGGEPWVSD